MAKRKRRPCIDCGLPEVDLRTGLCRWCKVKRMATALLNDKSVAYSTPAEMDAATPPPPRKGD